MFYRYATLHVYTAELNAQMHLPTVIKAMVLEQSIGIVSVVPPLALTGCFKADSTISISQVHYFYYSYM